MKPTQSALTCRIVRIWKGMTDQEDPARGLGSSHIAQCRECQAYFLAAGALTAQLHREAVEQRLPVPAGLDARILAALADESPAPAPARHYGRLVLAFGGVAAALALALVPVWRAEFGRHPIDHPTVAATSNGTDLALFTRPLPSLNDSVNAVLEKEPLQKEVNSVYADARSAVNFLALNFLPEGTTPAPAQQSKPSRG